MRRLFWPALILLLLAASVGVIELAARLLPMPWEYQGPVKLRHRPHPVLGWWRKPDVTQKWSSTCYRVDDIHVNHFGMRDRPRKLAKKKFRIALLGDSMVEGYQVPDRQVVNRVMERMLGDKVEVLNFGFSGYGTVQEMVLYDYLASRFKPDLVILCFFPKNDVRDNSMALRSRYLRSTGVKPPDNMPFFTLDHQGRLVQIHKPSGRYHYQHLPRRESALWRWVKKTATYRLVDYFYRKAIVPAWYHLKFWFTGRIETTDHIDATDRWWTAVYQPPPTPQWRRAWRITEAAILALERKVRRDGGKLVVITIPYKFDFSDIPKELYLKTGQTLSKDFDPSYPHRRLAEFCAKHGIIFKSFVPEFRRYIAEHHLSPPYFSWPCDGHYRPLGHRVLAACLVSFLRAKGLLPPGVGGAASQPEAASVGSKPAAVPPAGAAREGERASAQPRRGGEGPQEARARGGISCTR